jgi:hypothetical protein
MEDWKQLREAAGSCPVMLTPLSQIGLQYHWLATTPQYQFIRFLVSVSFAILVYYPRLLQVVAGVYIKTQDFALICLH